VRLPELTVIIGLAGPQGVPIPAARSDAVAEASLSALAALLGRVTLANPEQLKGLLQRLLPIVTLPRTAAAEEVSCSKQHLHRTTPA